MKFANLRSLRINSHAVLQDLSREDVVLTNRGKPVAAIVYMDEDLLESYVLAHHPTLLRTIERDISRWKAGTLRAYSLEEARRRVLGGARGRGKRTP